MFSLIPPDCTRLRAWVPVNRSFFHSLILLTKKKKPLSIDVYMYLYEWSVRYLQIVKDVNEKLFSFDIESKYVYDLWEYIGIYVWIYIVLRYFIWVYQIKRIRTYVKDDIFSELIFRHLSVLLVILTITMPRQSRRFLMIIYLYCADIWDRVYVCVCRIASDFCPQRLLVCYLSIRVFCFTKKERTKRKDRIFLYSLLYYIWYKGYLSFFSCIKSLLVKFFLSFFFFWYIT